MVYSYCKGFSPDMQEEMYIFSEFPFSILTKALAIWYDLTVKAEVTASHHAA